MVREKLSIKREEIESVYSKYKKIINMSYSELKKWSQNPISRLASLDRTPIERNLRLLSKPKKDWNLTDLKYANMTISFVSRMKKVKRGKRVAGKYSKRDISLLNWAFNPFK